MKNFRKNNDRVDEKTFWKKLLQQYEQRNALLKKQEEDLRAEFESEQKFFDCKSFSPSNSKTILSSNDKTLSSYSFAEEDDNIGFPTPSKCSEISNQNEIKCFHDSGDAENNFRIRKPVISIFKQKLLNLDPMRCKLDSEDIILENEIPTINTDKIPCNCTIKNQDIIHADKGEEEDTEDYTATNTEYSKTDEDFQYIKQIKYLRCQLAYTLQNLSYMEETNAQLRSELCTLKEKCNNIKIDFIERKICEAHAVSQIKEKFLNYKKELKGSHSICYLKKNFEETLANMANFSKLNSEEVTKRVQKRQELEQDDTSDKKITDPRCKCCFQCTCEKETYHQPEKSCIEEEKLKQQMEKGDFGDFDKESEIKREQDIFEKMKEVIPEIDGEAIDKISEIEIIPDEAEEGGEQGLESIDFDTEIELEEQLEPGAEIQLIVELDESELVDKYEKEGIISGGELSVVEEVERELIAQDLSDYPSGYADADIEQLKGSKEVLEREFEQDQDSYYGEGQEKLISSLQGEPTFDDDRYGEEAGTREREGEKISEYYPDGTVGYYPESEVGKGSDYDEEKLSGIPGDLTGRAETSSIGSRGRESFVGSKEVITKRRSGIDSKEGIADGAKFDRGEQDIGRATDYSKEKVSDRPSFDRGEQDITRGPASSKERVAGRSSFDRGEQDIGRGPASSKERVADRSSFDRGEHDMSRGPAYSKEKVAEGAKFEREEQDISRVGPTYSKERVADRPSFDKGEHDISTGPASSKERVTGRPSLDRGEKDIDRGSAYSKEKVAGRESFERGEQDFDKDSEYWQKKQEGRSSLTPQDQRYSQRRSEDVPGFLGDEQSLGEGLVQFQRTSGEISSFVGDQQSIDGEYFQRKPEDISSFVGGEPSIVEGSLETSIRSSDFKDTLDRKPSGADQFDEELFPSYDGSKGVPDETSIISEKDYYSIQLQEKIDAERLSELEKSSLRSGAPETEQKHPPGCECVDCLCSEVIRDKEREKEQLFRQVDQEVTLPLKSIDSETRDDFPSFRGKLGDSLDVDTHAVADSNIDGEIGTDTDILRASDEVLGYCEFDALSIDRGPQTKKSDEAYNVTTAIADSGKIDVITEGPEGIIQTTMTYTPSGNIDVQTEITEFECEVKDECIAKAKESILYADVTDSAEFSPDFPKDTDELTRDVADVLNKANQEVLDALNRANQNVSDAMEKANKDVESALAVVAESTLSRKASSLIGSPVRSVQTTIYEEEPIPGDKWLEQSTDQMETESFLEGTREEFGPQKLSETDKGDDISMKPGEGRFEQDTDLGGQAWKGDDDYGVEESRYRPRRRSDISESGGEDRGGETGYGQQRRSSDIASTEKDRRRMSQDISRDDYDTREDGYGQQRRASSESYKGEDRRQQRGSSDIASTEKDRRRMSQDIGREDYDTREDGYGQQRRASSDSSKGEDRRQQRGSTDASKAEDGRRMSQISGHLVDYDTRGDDYGQPKRSSLDTSREEDDRRRRRGSSYVSEGEGRSKTRQELLGQGSQELRENEDFLIKDGEREGQKSQTWGERTSQEIIGEGGTGREKDREGEIDDENIFGAEDWEERVVRKDWGFGQTTSESAADENIEGIAEKIFDGQEQTAGYYSSGEEECQCIDHPPDCTCVDCLCKEKVKIRAETDGRKHPEDCDCINCICGPGIINEVTGKTCHPPDCMCLHCICSPMKGKTTQRTKQSDIKESDIHPEDCECLECICTRGTGLTLKEKISPVCTRDDKELVVTIMDADDIICSHRPGCDCVECLCKEYERRLPEMYDKYSGLRRENFHHTSSCECFECLCNMNGDGSNNSFECHSVNCNCINCLCCQERDLMLENVRVKTLCSFPNRPEYCTCGENYKSENNKHSSDCPCYNENLGPETVIINASSPRGVEVIDVKRISLDSLLIKWTESRVNEVTGYEIFVNGVSKSRIYSRLRTAAVLHSINFDEDLDISLYSTFYGECLEPPTKAFFEIPHKCK